MLGSTVAIVPARGGSKSIPRKNLADLGGKPLLAWSIDVAKQVSAVGTIVVTTDDPEIAEVARGYGAQAIMRPPELATDTALVIDAIRHVLAVLRDRGQQVRTAVLLEPTCPLRSPADVEACIAWLEDDSFDSVATFTEATLNPHRAWRIQDGLPRPFLDGADPWQPRQKLPPAVQLNGAVYAFRADRLPATGSAVLFGKMAAVMMPRERSIDIDDEQDLAIAAAVLASSERARDGSVQ